MIVGGQCDIADVRAREKGGDVEDLHLRAVLVRGGWPIRLSFEHPALSDVEDFDLLLDGREM